MQHWERPQDPYNTQINIQHLHDKTLILTRAPTAPRVTIQSENTKSITPLTQTYNIFHHSKAQKPTIFNNGRYTTNIPTDPHTVTTTDIKTNVSHIHTYIVSRHLATRGNNKILRTPPPHISSPKELLPRLTRRTLAQLRTNKSPFLKSYLHNLNAKSLPSPLCTLCNNHTHTTHIISSTAPTYAPHCHLWICGRTRGIDALLARWTEKLGGGSQAGRSDSPN